MNKPKVVLHYEHIDDIPTVYFEGDVDVYSVCEFSPDDRIYKFTQRGVPDEMLDGPIGAMGDGSDAEVRLMEAMDRIEQGLPPKNEGLQ